MSAEIRIGTSGYHYKHWVGAFYPPKTPSSKMLEFYVQHFDTLELNNSSIGCQRLKRLNPGVTPHQRILVLP